MTTGAGAGPLAGVRVADLTRGPGRYAGHLLAGMGADVVRLQPGETGPPLLPADPGGVLEWWYDHTCRALPLDLTHDGARRTLHQLVARADLLLDDADPGELAGLGLAPGELARMNPALVQVSLTPFGATGPRAGWRSSDLVAQAHAGILSVTGDEDRPVPLWGRQSVVVGGLYAVVTALAGLRQARRTGTGTWADLSLHEALVSCTEHLLMYWWFPEALAPLGAPIARRQRSLHWIRAFEVVPCRRGACMVSPAAGGLLGLIAWLKARGHASDVPDEPAEGQLLGLIPVLMAALRAAALESDATELFEAGQSLHVPFGEAYSIDQVAACPQHHHRAFFHPVAGREHIVVPGPAARFGRTPSPAPTPPNRPVELDALLADWAVATPVGTTPPAAAGPDGPDGPTDGDPRPLAGVRVLDFTHVLAGPFATRVLADLGAEVIRIQTEKRSGGTGANEFPYNVLWARNKTSIQLSMRHPDALGVLRSLVERADVLIENFSAGVLPSWGAGPDELATWNPRLISVSMSGCGADGPWASYVTYAPTIHALSGFTALTGPAGESDCGPGIAFNDHISGLVAATAVLGALAERDVSGRGQHVECSQLEVGTTLVGPALVEHLATGRVPRSTGTADPFADLVVNDVLAAAGPGSFLAVTVADGHAWAPVAAALGLSPDPATAPVELGRWAAGQDVEAAVALLQSLGVAAGRVADAAVLTGSDPQLEHRSFFTAVDSEMIGRQHLDRFPARLHPGAGEPLDLTYTASPWLGQHNFAAYSGLLGWDEARVAEAMGDGLLS